MALSVTLDILSRFRILPGIAVFPRRNRQRDPDASARSENGRTMSDDAPAVTSLQSKIERAGGPVPLLRSSALGPYQFPGIPPEFTNWRDEVRAWKDGVALLEQSYHMTELHLRGSGVIAFLKELAVNKLDVFPVGRAKQLVLAAPDGNLIADAIIFHEEENFYRVVGAPFASDWLLFNSESTDHDVSAEKNDN